jgi:hypothetical protein
MSRERLDRVGKLQRLRELEEAREAMALRERQRESSEAAAHEAAAELHLRAHAAGKTASTTNGLDIERYRATLALEARSIDAVLAAGETRRHADAARGKALDRHASAAAATKVADSRRQRLEVTERHESEVRDADRLADLRAAAKGGLK